MTTTLFLLAALSSAHAGGITDTFTTCGCSHLFYDDDLVTTAEEAWADGAEAGDVVAVEAPDALACLEAAGFWNGSSMTFGDGRSRIILTDGEPYPFSGLVVVAAEDGSPLLGLVLAE